MAAVGTGDKTSRRRLWSRGRWHPDRIAAVRALDTLAGHRVRLRDRPSAVAREGDRHERTSEQVIGKSHAPIHIRCPDPDLERAVWANQEKSRPALTTDPRIHPPMIPSHPGRLAVTPAVLSFLLLMPAGSNRPPLLVCPCGACKCPEPEQWPGPLRCDRRCGCREFHVPSPDKPRRRWPDGHFRAPHGDDSKRLIVPGQPLP